MKSILTAFLMLIAMTIVTGIFYPLMVTSIGQLLWSEKANGSLIKQHDVVIGSALIAQSFVNEKYFWPRPSASDFRTTPSQASNFGPTNKTLKDEIENRKINFSQIHDVKSQEITVDNLTTSGSGLDPHILEKNALMQLRRIVKARHLQKNDEERAQKIVIDHAQKNGIFSAGGDRIVNVLLLNLQLDQEFKE